METTLGAGAVIAGIVAIAKAAYPGTLSSRATLSVVGVAAVLVLGLEMVSGLVHDTPYGLLVQLVTLVTTAIGVREGATAVAPSLSALPTRNATP